MVSLEVAPDLPLSAGIVEAAPVAVGPAGEGLRAACEAEAGRLRATHGAALPKDIAALRPARELYRAFGIDPTRTRPSSEALVRRALRGQPFPAILDAVDVGNLLAVRFGLPLGLYDAGKIDGAVTLRRGAAGERYRGIGKDEVHLAGRPVLADARGPFGNPTSDSARTAVDQATAALWMVIFGPRDYPAERMERHVAAACEELTRWLSPPGGRAVARGEVR